MLCTLCRASHRKGTDFVEISALQDEASSYMWAFHCSLQKGFSSRLLTCYYEASWLFDLWCCCCCCCFIVTHPEYLETRRDIHFKNKMENYLKTYYKTCHLVLQERANSRKIALPQQLNAASIKSTGLKWETPLIGMSSLLPASTRLLLKRNQQFLPWRYHLA